MERIVLRSYPALMDYFTSIFRWKVDEVDLVTSLESPDEPGSLREGSNRAGVEEGSGVSVKRGDALS